jgi:indole-3-glycerol phosphate synthase
MNILDKIVQHKQKEVKERESLFPKKLLEKSIFFNTPCVSLKEYILRKDKQGVIAEFKRKSPSNENINIYADIKEITIGYMQAGASALSVLTDNTYFGGSLEDLKRARTYNFCPILQKDFILSEYQIIEAKSYGADAILLISAILSKKELHELYSFANSLGLEVIVEIHHESELDKAPLEKEIIGVNNRNLENMEVSVENSIKISDKINSDILKISESGIKTPEQIAQLRKVGFNGFLIGESFMKKAHPAKELKLFIENINKLSYTFKNEEFVTN